MSIKGATDEELGEGMPEFTIDDITQEDVAFLRTAKVEGWRNASLLVL